MAKLDKEMEQNSKEMQLLCDEIRDFVQKARKSKKPESIYRKLEEVRCL